MFNTNPTHPTRSTSYFSTYASPFNYTSTTYASPRDSGNTSLTTSDIPRLANFIYTLSDADANDLLRRSGIDHDWFASRAACSRSCGHSHDDFASPPNCGRFCGHAHSTYASSLVCRLTCAHSASDFPTSYQDAARAFYSNPRSVTLGGTTYVMSLVDNWVSFHLSGWNPRTDYHGYFYVT
jgi:hypothetical protein